MAPGPSTASRIPLGPTLMTSELGFFETSQFLLITIFHSFRNIGPTNSLTAAILTYGEGWHNFHHTFPWDYRSAETGLGKDRLNMTANFIDFFAKFGWAYDLKLASKDLILRQAKKKGDGSRFVGGKEIIEANNEE